MKAEYSTFFFTCLLVYIAKGFCGDLVGCKVLGEEPDRTQ